MESLIRKPSDIVAPVFEGLGAKKSTARAASRDLEKAFASTSLCDLVARRPDDVRKMVEEIATSVANDAGISDSSVPSKAVGAVFCALSSTRPIPERGDIHRQVCVELSRHPLSFSRSLSDRILSTLSGSVASTDIDHFSVTLFDAPTRALKDVVKVKVSKFFTRGVSEEEIMNKSLQELSSLLANSLKKGLSV
jgi:hypothetical protein